MTKMEYRFPEFDLTITEDPENPLWVTIIITEYQNGERDVWLGFVCAPTQQEALDSIPVFMDDPAIVSGDSDTTTTHTCVEQLTKRLSATYAAQLFSEAISKASGFDEGKVL